jgi:ABC-type sulfate transport system permease component
MKNESWITTRNNSSFSFATFYIFILFFMCVPLVCVLMRSDERASEAFGRVKTRKSTLDLCENSMLLDLNVN